MSDEGGFHHGVDYIEISVTDMARAKAFYGEAFGWRFNDYGPGYTGYVDGARGDREAGGFRLEESVATGGPLVILFSRDIDATLAAVQAAGGEIVAPIFEFPGGRRFELLDPFGNRLGVWTTPAS